jgi:CelD/BcsL family acetyltransferase involved in cellulose biosynthesis
VDVEVLTDADQLEALKPEWDALLAASARPRPSLMHEWMTTSSRHFGNGNPPFAVCLRDGGKLVAIAPFREVTRRLAGLPVMRRLEFAVEVADCRDLIVKSGAEWRAVETLLEWLKTDCRRWDLLRLRGLCSRSPTSSFLPLQAAQAGLAACTFGTQSCANLDLPPSMDDFLREMPGRRRRNAYVRYGRKLVREHGQPVLRVLSGSEVTQADLDRLCELHRSGWAARGGSCVLDVRFHDFLAELSRAAAPKGQPVVAFLQLEDREVAGHYGFLLNGRFFLYVVGFDSAYASYSIGAQGLLALIEYGIEQGWSEIDLMKGGERYKFDFTRRCCRATDVWIARSAARLRATSAVAALRGQFCN